ncbi:14165_t:CDS:2 [Funneliformis caledonium]|uniref:14165_t:CDS:1 n=1 Tax=Funneliformis caledonium TaxID=1117310 RepID=A0A9N9EVS1_9GLOM|nr:14165_t:CDS:2 [Funneliformis caledonium]
MQQLILESDFPKLREEIDNAINTRKELERLEKTKPSLPVELNMIIEEMVATDYTRSSQQDNHKRLVKYEKEKNKHLENIYRFQQYIGNYKQEKEKYLTNIQETLNTEISGIQKLREKARQQKEIEEILTEEIKEYQAK